MSREMSAEHGTTKSKCTNKGEISASPSPFRQMRRTPHHITIDTRYNAKILHNIVYDFTVSFHNSLCSRRRKRQLAVFAHKRNGKYLGRHFDVNFVMLFVRFVAAVSVFVLQQRHHRHHRHRQRNIFQPNVKCMTTNYTEWDGEHKKMYGQSYFACALDAL